tara:strand:+ start:152 stop:283 length:132 start_codon:yes stop_codon:yes gene_type:complete
MGTPRALDDQEKESSTALAELKLLWPGEPNIEAVEENKRAGAD